MKKPTDYDYEMAEQEIDPESLLPSVEDVMSLVDAYNTEECYGWDDAAPAGSAVRLTNAHHQVEAAVTRLHTTAVHAQAMAEAAIFEEEGIGYWCLICDGSIASSRKEVSHKADCPVAAYHASLAAKESETR